MGLCNSKLVPVLAIKERREEHMNMDEKAQDIMSPSGEHTPLLIHGARQTKIQPCSEVIVIVAADAKNLVHIGLLLNWDSVLA